MLLVPLIGSKRASTLSEFHANELNCTLTATKKLEQTKKKQISVHRCHYPVNLETRSCPKSSLVRKFHFLTIQNKAKHSNASLRWFSGSKHNRRLELFKSNFVVFCSVLTWIHRFEICIRLHQRMQTVNFQLASYGS